MIFSREFSNWPIHGDEQLNLVYVETTGRDLDDMLCNAVITLEDWHGNEGPDWDFCDLPEKDFRALEQMFVEALAAREGA